MESTDCNQEFKLAVISHRCAALFVYISDSIQVTATPISATQYFSIGDTVMVLCTVYYGAPSATLINPNQTPLLTLNVVTFTSAVSMITFTNPTAMQPLYSQAVVDIASLKR